MIKYLTAGALWVWFLSDRSLVDQNIAVWFVAGALCCAPYLAGEFLQAVVDGYRGKNVN